MPRIAPNADTYAAARVGIFFPAHNQTPVDGNLTGQCVTLNKWFLAEMTDVPNPFSARGDARYVGQTLVRQGHAVEMPFDQRKPGDFICYEYGTYGHIALQLSGGRVFEENVNMPGTTRRLVDGAYVYSARIGSENESWRVGKNPHVYRIKGYSEGGPTVAIIQNADNWRARVNRTVNAFWGRSFTEAEFQSVVGKDTLTLLEILGDNPETDNNIRRANVGRVAINDKWDQQIYTLQDAVKVAQADLATARKLVDELDDRPTAEQLEAVTEQLRLAEERAAKAQADLDAKIKKDAETDEKVNGFFRSLWNKLTGGK